MDAKTNYTLVGLAVIVLATALIAACLWLSVGFGQKKYSVYAVYIHEAVSGLSEQSPVKFNGVQVGNVFKIKLSHNDPQEVMLLLNIEEGTPITTSTSATLISQGITGTSFVGLAASSSDLTPLKKIPNQPYPIIPTKPSLFHQLDAVVKDISENINNVSVHLKEIFDDENTLLLKKSLISIESFTKTIAQNSAVIDSSLHNSDVLLKNMASVSKDLPGVIRDLKFSMNKLTKQIGTAGDNVTEAMEAGKETFTKVSQQALPSAISLLNHLNAIAANLENVSTQLRQNPSVLIRGTTTPKPGPGEQK